jgi:putative phosphoesterase
MKVCVVSDSHDRARDLAAAVMAGKAAGAELVIHCGDVIGAQTLKPLLALGLPVHVVHGNNLGDPVMLTRVCADSGGLLTYHGADATLTLSGRRIFVTHYPHYARGMACTGEYDVVFYGHSHETAVAPQPNIAGGTTWLVNPGTVAGLAAPPTWILADLPALTFSIHPVVAADG